LSVIVRNATFVLVLAFLLFVLGVQLIRHLALANRNLFKTFTPTHIKLISVSFRQFCTDMEYEIDKKITLKRCIT